MRKKGFTLVESILVITIILILISAVSLTMSSIYKVEEDKRIENELFLILSAGKAYHLAFPADDTITEKKLVEKKFLAHSLSEDDNETFQIRINSDKIQVSFLKKGIPYQYKDGRYARWEE